MDIIITYDINTETKAGQKRLRKIATACKNYGQRVQYSVFECRINEAQYETLCHELQQIIDPKKDSLRIYRLPDNREWALKCYGVDKYTDFDDVLIL